MWMFNFLPDSVLQVFILMIIFIGVGGYILGTFGGLFLGIKPYSSLIKTISTILLVLGVYLYGGYGVEMTWRQRAADLQAQIDKKNAVSEQVTEKIVTRYVDKVKIVKEKTDANVKEITKYITKEVDSGCSIPDDFRLLHSRASGNEVSETSAGSNATSTK